MLRSIRPAFALFIPFLIVPPALAAPPSLRIEPYAFRLADGSDLAAERGTFTVPEDRKDPRSRRIEIGFVRFKSTNPNPGAPIVYLAGGPGGSGVATARGPRQPVFLALRQVADVIALDQRGIGLSNHIPLCTAKSKLDSARVLNEATLTFYYRDTLAECVSGWRAAGVAVNGYTTIQNAEDLEDLRKALGARKIDLWAISYGTHLAMAMMRQHPRSVGRVVLASAEGMDQTVKLPLHVDAAFERMDSATGKPLTALIRRVHSKFDSAPQTFTLANGASFQADSFPLRMMAGFVAKNPDGIPQLLQAYGALDSGQNQAIAPLVWSYFYKEPLRMSGMPELTDSASGISAARLALVRRQAATALSGMAINFPMPQIGGIVPGLDLGDGFRREIRSSHPVLLLAGDLDVRTPLEEQAEATSGLRNLKRILVRNGGHDLFEAHPDVPALLVAFFSGRPVTTSELVLPRPSLAAR